MLMSCLILLLISNSLNRKKDKSIIYSRNLIFILLFSSIILFNSCYLNKYVGLSVGLYYVSYISNIFHLFILMLSFVITSLTSYYPRKPWNKNFSSVYKIIIFKLIYNTNNILNKLLKQFRIIEYPLIILFIIIGSLFLVNSSDLISIFLSIELQSYGLYIISTIHRNSELSTSAGLTYFLLGGLSSCLILLGSAILYVNAGLSYLEGLYVITNISDFSLENLSNIYWYKAYYIQICLIILSVGFLFKISAAPFHFWSPYVYDSIPTITTSFVAVISKISIFILLLELVHFTNKSLFIGNYNWTISLLISCLLSLIIGATGGLTQFRIKKLYAYSTVSHIGFILLALSVDSTESIQAFIFYIIQYSITNLNAFIILISIGYSFYFLLNNYNNNNIQEKNNSPIQYISQLKGYFYINTYLSISLIITFFSFVGVPPLIGFFGKQMVLSAALDKGYIFLILIAIFTSIISAVYYLAVIKQITFYKSEYKYYENIKLYAYVLKNNELKKKIIIKSIVLSSSLTVIISIITLTLLLYILTPKEFLDMTNILSLIIFNF